MVLIKKNFLENDVKNKLFKIKHFFLYLKFYL